jgi:hypothetical protein
MPARRNEKKYKQKEFSPKTSNGHFPLDSSTKMLSPQHQKSVFFVHKQKQEHPENDAVLKKPKR